MSHRRERLESVIKRTVQTVLSEGMADPRLDALLTVTEVKVSPDRRDATIGVVVTPEQHESRAIHGLASAAGAIRRALSTRAEIHKPPELTFRIDKAHKKQAGFLDALNKVRAERSDEPADDDTPADDQNANDPPAGETTS